MFKLDIIKTNDNIFFKNKNFMLYRAELELMI